MAQRTITTLTDDIDGSEADETVEFTFGGTQYEIDLSTANSEALRAVIGPWIEKARRAQGGSGPARRARSAGSRPSRSGMDVAAIRDWARANGHKVRDRGRVSAEIVAAYVTATSV